MFWWLRKALNILDDLALLKQFVLSFAEMKLVEPIMTKILAFAASSSKQSINKKLVTYATNLLTDTEVEIIDLNDYELPLFSVDKESELKQQGIDSPALAVEFFNKIKNSDALVISFAEHNGSYTAAYKNLFDWASRINPKVFQNKTMFCLSTSPGGRGGASVIAKAVDSAAHFGGQVIGQFSLPKFYDNFAIEDNEITDSEKKAELHTLMEKFRQTVR